jgi:hypothetical protein
MAVLADETVAHRIWEIKLTENGQVAILVGKEPQTPESWEKFSGWDDPMFASRESIIQCPCVQAFLIVIKAQCKRAHSLLTSSPCRALS